MRVDVVPSTSSVRFSTAPSTRAVLARLKLIDDCTVSVPFDTSEALIDDVAGIVDDIDVVASAAAHGVGASAAIQHVDAGIAGEHVVKARCRCR